MLRPFRGWGLGQDGGIRDYRVYQVNSIQEDADHSDDTDEHRDGGSSSVTCRGREAGFDMFVTAPQGVGQ